MPDTQNMADPSPSEDDAASGMPAINAEALSERIRLPSYEELYGTKPKPEAPRRHPLRLLSRLPAMIVAVPLTLALMMAVLAFRAAIVACYPQANLIFAAAGLSVNERGLDLRHVRVNLLHDGPQPLLIVDGEIANGRAEKIPVPALRLAVRDTAGHEIYTWSAASPKAKLESGETVAFRARLAAPPSDGHDVFVRFAAAAP